MSVAAGTAVHLIARPDGAATFDGWEGACAGAGECDLALAHDAELTARFGAPPPPPPLPPSPCEGIAPLTMGTPVSATLPTPGSHEYCDGATSDGEGNVAHQVYGFVNVWQVYGADGKEKGRLRDAYGIAAQASGFHALGFSFSAWKPDGTLLATVDTGGATNNNVATWMLPARTGGSVVVSTDAWGCPNGAKGTATFKIWRFAASGAVRSVVDIGGTGCPTGASWYVNGVSDERDNTFIALNTGGGAPVFGFPRLRVIARWIDASGVPMTPWTDVAAEGDVQVAPLIGGGVVFRAGDYVASFASGSVTPAAAPGFIPQYHDAVVIRGGRGYAVVPRMGWTPDRAIELYSLAGDHCGTIPVPDGAWPFVGRDGTVITVGPDNFCTATWWPGLLR